jgi:hypothetical protein
VVVTLAVPPAGAVAEALPEGVVTVVDPESVAGGVTVVVVAPEGAVVVVTDASAAGGVVASTVVVSFLVQPPSAAKPRVTAAAMARGLVRRMSGDLQFECLRPTTEHHG